MNVLKSELLKLPYITNIPEDGRSINIRLYYNDKENKFKGFIQFNDGSIYEYEIIDLVIGAFWSKLSIKNSITDKIFNLLYILENYFSYPEMTHIITSLESDIFNFASIIHKQFIFFDYNIDYNSNKLDLSNIYKTELEYLMGLIRSFYDLLYDVLKILFNKYEFYKNEKNSKLPNLPKTLGSFADSINLDELFKKYLFNKPLVDYFNYILPIFKMCRYVRDLIFHKGSNFSYIYITEKGPGININQKLFEPFKQFFFKNKLFMENLENNSIGSLFFFINEIIYMTLKASDDFSIILKKSFNLLTPISKNYKLIFRSNEMKYLNYCTKYKEACLILNVEDKFR